MQCSRTTIRVLAYVCGMFVATVTAYAQPGTVLSHQKISDAQGGGPPLDDADQFGFAVASLGDINGDGVGDIAVGVRLDDDGGFDRGAVWILFLNPDGTVNFHQKISDTQGGFKGVLDDQDQFGYSVGGLGDLDGDGVADLAVGANADDDGGDERGAVWVLFLNTDGTVKSHQKISSTQGGGPPLDNVDLFGWSIASLGDLDGDDVSELAVGALGDGDGGPFHGAVWVLFLNTNGTVKSHQKISDTQGGFTGTLEDGERFGWSVASLGNLDDDGVVDLVVGQRNDSDGGPLSGAVWVLFLNSDGTVKAHQKTSATEGAGPPLDTGDGFGSSVTSLGDLDGDGITDLAVGVPGDDDGGDLRGAMWVLFLNTNGMVKGHQKISDTQGGGPPLDDGDSFGASAASLGDLDGDGITDLAVGVPGDDDGGNSRGAVWILFLDGVPCPLGFGKCETEPPLILFREADDSAFGWGPEGIPGFDHVGFYHSGTVYEAHPGYDGGDYWDPRQEEFVHVLGNEVSNVQTVHTLGSFQHDSMKMKSDSFNQVAEIDEETANSMQAFIETQMGEPFFNPDCTFGGALCIIPNLHPSIQKHILPANNGKLAYTCCGLIERASEEAGVNFGQGFVYDMMETFASPIGLIPMLSPQLMAFVLGAEETLGEPASWFAGLLDPVDFMLTDPLGRMLGHTEELGTINEIPNSLFTGDGIVEYVAIHNPVPGTYTIQLVGLGEQADAAFGGTVPGQLFQGFLEVGETTEMVFVLPDTCPADLDDSGDVGPFDLASLLGAWGPCPEPCEAGDPADTCPADLDGNCEVGPFDLASLLGSWGPCE